MPVVKGSEWLLEWLDGNTIVKPLLSRKVSAGHEFRSAPNGDQGFKRCWGVDGSEPMIIDIYGAASAELSARIGQLSASGQVGLQHLTDADIEGTQKTNRIRQRQLAAFRTNEEVFDPEGAQELMSVSYPLAFFDIETSRVPLPYAPGMASYQQTVFQFSVHILRTSESTDLEHHEWLDLDNRYPNATIEQLRLVLGDKNRFMWSQYEQTALRDTKEQLASLGQFSDDTAHGSMSWPGRTDAAGGVNKRLYDLSEVSRRSYAHPLMNGSHSIKRVLDAVWSQNKELWTNSWFKNYLKVDGTGNAVDPYKVLVSREREKRNGSFIEIDVNDGVAAMRAYQSLMFGPHRNDAEYADGLQNALLAYCELDTVAMVMIWLHFIGLLKAS